MRDSLCISPDSPSKHRERAYGELFVELASHFHMYIFDHRL